jgi:hypothetical protein
MAKLFELKPEYHEYMPSVLERGILYISHRFKIAIHLCACGCGGKTVTPFSEIIDGVDIGWNVTEKDGKVTLRPSIGNFSGENPYHAHYYITENKIEWL